MPIELKRLRGLAKEDESDDDTQMTSEQQSQPVSEVRSRINVQIIHKWCMLMYVRFERLVSFTVEPCK